MSIRPALGLHFQQRLQCYCEIVRTISEVGKLLGTDTGINSPPPPVIVHTKWSTSWLGLPENVKLIELDEVVLPLPTGLLLPSIAESMMVSRAVVSTVHVNKCRRWVYISNSVYSCYCEIVRTIS